jgi:hypothetical protein
VAPQAITSQFARLTWLQPQPLDYPRLERPLGNLHTQREGICLPDYCDCGTAIF